VTILGSQVTLKHKDAIKALKFKYSNQPPKWRKPFAKETFSRDRVFADLSQLLKDSPDENFQIEIESEGVKTNYHLTNAGVR
jgi:hypothetical protein